MLLVTKRKIDAAKSELKTLAKELETRAMTDDEMKKVDERKAELNKLQEQYENEKYLAELQDGSETKEVPKDKEDRDFQTRARNFSVAKLVNAHTNPNIDAGSEREISAELQRKNALNHGQYTIPWEALETRATLASPANLTTDDYKPAMLIDVLRNSLVMGRLGATMLTGLSQRVSIPKKTAATGAGQWLGEEAGATEGSAMTFGEVVLDYKKYIQLASFTKQAAMEAMPSIEMITRQDLIDSVSREMDRVALYGTGSNNQPRGLIPRLTASTQTGTVTNGKELTYAEVLELENLVDAENIESTRRAYLCNSKIRNTLKRTLKFASAGSETIWNGGGVDGMPTQVSNVVKSDNTTGNKKTSDFVYGQWSDLIIATFSSGIQLLLNELGDGYSSGTTQLRALIMCDTNVRRAESFKYYNTVL